MNDVEAARVHRDVLRRVGLTHQSMGGGQSALGFGGHSLYTAGRAVLQSAFPMGGAGGVIARHGYQAAQAAHGDILSGGGLSPLPWAAASAWRRSERSRASAPSPEGGLPRTSRRTTPTSRARSGRWCRLHRGLISRSRPSADGNDWQLPGISSRRRSARSEVTGD